MTLFINNDVAHELLTMDDTMELMEQTYRDLVTTDVVCRPRMDMQIPTGEHGKLFQWGTMEGGAVGGYFAIRMKSDILYERNYNGAVTQEQYCIEPGTFCGLIFLISVRNGEPLALINDGVVQHMRVGADGGIGVKYMARDDAAVVGMLGSGGMARSHMESFTRVRPIEKLQVYSPTAANREAFGQEIRDRYGIEVKVCGRPEDIYKGAHIVAALTDSAVPVLDGGRIEKGAHIVSVGGGGGRPDAVTLEKVDLYLRFGTAPAPWTRPEFGVADEYITYAARTDVIESFGMKRPGLRGHGVALPDKIVHFAEIVQGTNRGRTSRDQITYSERGNLQGAQFFGVAGRIYELARERNLGHELPTEWFVQDIRN
jgi:ornithine cyclodeaminase/alanine dehydrogenase-like protein (mu-crystallin family)